MAAIIITAAAAPTVGVTMIMFVHGEWGWRSHSCRYESNNINWYAGDIQAVVAAAVPKLGCCLTDDDDKAAIEPLSAGAVESQHSVTPCFTH